MAREVMILMRENHLFRWSLEGVGPEMATGEASAPFGPQKVKIFRAHPLPMALEIDGEGANPLLGPLEVVGPENRDSLEINSDM